ncbi:UDP-N-acetyl-D-mannosaminuronic acid transferase [Rhodobiaceae bacterium]|nr:UDP-N-acetyl-D-mannosaminuronic acid transferase [Rhodobiaceae bacterium]
MSIERRKVEVSGLPIQTFRSVADAANWALNEQGGVFQGAAVALNAEKIARSYKKKNYFGELQKFCFFYADGAPVAWITRRENPESNRVPGVELWEEVMKISAQRDLRVYLLGADEDTNRQTAELLESRFGLKKLLRRNGFFDDQTTILEELKAFRPDVVTVAMGSPRQERFIEEAFAAHPHTFYMGVGGTYDVFTGKVARAPAWMQQLSLEWLYRLARAPSRLGRYTILLKFLFLWALRKI